MFTKDRLMHVLVLHNAIDGTATAADLDVLVQVEAVADALRLGGCAVDLLPVSLNLDELREALASIRPDVAVNLVESLAGRDRLAPLAPALLDVLGCPYTGSPASALFSLCDKVKAKERLRWAGLPTPEWHVASDGRVERQGCVSHSAAAKYIIKPIHDHASYGIDADSVISATDTAAVHAALADRERLLHRRCFAERFIDGREFNLSILAGPNGPEVLPPAEILFVGFPADEPRIVNYDAKWEPDSYVFQNTPRQFEFPNSDRPLLDELSRLTKACWHLFGLRGYARVDFRVDLDGSPAILEVNANPCLSPDAGFAAALERAGCSFREAVERIVADALGEYPCARAAVRADRPRPPHWQAEFENCVRLA